VPFLGRHAAAQGPPRRVSPEKGHVVDVVLAPSPAGGAELLVIVQDAAAKSEGAGDRIVRYVVGEGGDGGKRARVEATELVDGGVGHAPADVAWPRVIVFTDAAEHAHLVPLGPSGDAAGAVSAEPVLDGLRVLASAPALGAVPPSSTALFAVDAKGLLRRFRCE